MRGLRERLRRAYGASPLHLLALIASLLIAAAAAVGWVTRVGSQTATIGIWFVGLIIGHDLVLLPLYSLLDWLAFGGRAAPKRSAHRPGARRAGSTFASRRC